ncbi:MAG: urease accessory protein UreD [Gemmobacter sp.]|uniref:urease accessory protein UreD n=1 Tax=Gemmobacter sp. TaxID=1898957 RepID=UPI001A4B3CA2|nr:urease accessory protein UreD [Gemmobacter sp.]MBL8562717.1 urease accessory protein UreD [Gemmobacter sp.]
MLDGRGWQALQRSAGRAEVAVEAGPHGAHLRKLRQEGSAKAFLPKGAPNEAVFLNTSGGLTGGDRLCFSLDLGDGLDFTATTQTAERAYASADGTAEMRVAATVGANARFAWLPQETILYENSRLRRVTDISLAQGATALICEMIILGRHAMQEKPRAISFQDVRRVHHGGRLLWSEAIRLGPGHCDRHQSTAILGGARCFATLALLGRDAESAAAALLPHMDNPACETAISAWSGKLILRAAAHHSWPLRCQLAQILSCLRGKPMPRVWQMNGDIL